MSGERPAPELGVEREIDLRRWLDAALTYWWIAAAGLVAGVVAGSLYTLGGSTMYTASALIARGQAFNPSGSGTVLSYQTSYSAVQNYATLPSSIATAAKKAGLTTGELRNHISVQTLNNVGQLSTTNTGSILVAITVQLKQPRKAETAADAIAAIVARDTTSGYVANSIHELKVRLHNYDVRLKTLQPRIQSLTETLQNSPNLPLVDKLVLLTELDTTQATQGQVLDSQATTQQQLTLAQVVETTQVVQPAEAEKVPAKSRRKAIAVGGLIGLIIGTGAALAYGVGVKRVRKTA